MMRNKEGYHDPTAEKAIRRVKGSEKRRDFYGRKMRRPLTYRLEELPSFIHMIK